MGMALSSMSMVTGDYRTPVCIPESMTSPQVIVMVLSHVVVLLRSARLAYDAHIPSDVPHSEWHALVTDGRFLRLLSFPWLSLLSHSNLTVLYPDKSLQHTGCSSFACCACLIVVCFVGIWVCMPRLPWHGSWQVAL